MENINLSYSAGVGVGVVGELGSGVVGGVVGGVGLAGRVVVGVGGCGGECGCG